MIIERPAGSSIVEIRESESGIVLARFGRENGQFSWSTDDPEIRRACEDAAPDTASRLAGIIAKILRRRKGSHEREL